MKTSTKLAILYGGLLLAGVLTLFIVSKTVKGYDVRHQAERMNTYAADLSDCSVVVLQDSAKCQLVFSDSNRIEWQTLKASPNPKAPAFVRNDTLYVKRSYTGNTWDLRIRVKHALAVYVQSGATVRLIEPIQPVLSVVTDNGECYLEGIEDHSKAEKLRQTLQLELIAKRKSYVELNSWIHGMTAVMDSSRLSVSSSCFIQTVNLTLKHGSEATFTMAPAAFVGVKDSTSTYRMY
jgi:hypothetical protein